VRVRPTLALLVISPFARQNDIHRGVGDQSSILRFIQDNRELGPDGPRLLRCRPGSLWPVFDLFSRSWTPPRMTVYPPPRSRQRLRARISATREGHGDRSSAHGPPKSPWQNPFAERLIGSIRGECLNHVLVLGERHLRRILTRYLGYYHQARTHLALDKDAPDLRPIELPVTGKIVQLPEVGGLHHRYVRQAA
jgi:transposase InsO family protein